MGRLADQLGRGWYDMRGGKSIGRGCHEGKESEAAVTGETGMMHLDASSIGESRLSSLVVLQYYKLVCRRCHRRGV